jgi:hypothetical protein
MIFIFIFYVLCFKLFDIRNKGLKLGIYFYIFSCFVLDLVNYMERKRLN